MYTTKTACVYYTRMTKYEYRWVSRKYTNFTAINDYRRLTEKSFGARGVRIIIVRYDTVGRPFSVTEAAQRRERKQSVLN